MKLFNFELKKIWRQRTLLYVMLVVVLFITGLFLYNYSRQAGYAEREREILDTYSSKIGELQNELQQKSYETGGTLTELEKNQLTELERAAAALFSWRVALLEGHHEDIPNHIQTFITHINAYEALGGSFESLPADERAVAWMKNEWMLEHDLVYEDEIYPISPLLLLKESGRYLFQIPGLLFLLFIFGMTITKEKEEETWRTLQTQPTRNSHIYMSKFGSLLVITCFYALFTLIYSICLPLLFGQNLVLNYPQLISMGNDIEIMSSIEYILSMIALFIGVMFFVYSLGFFVSTFVRQTFTMLAVMTFIIFIGYYSTVITPFLQNVWNPFHIMQFSALLDQPEPTSLWVYVMSTLVWAVILFVASIYLSEKRWYWSTKIFQTRGNKKSFIKGTDKVSTRPNIWIMIRFEIQKLKRKSLIGKVIILFILLIAFGFFVLKTESKERENTYLATVEHAVKREGSSYLIQHLEEIKELFQDDEAQLEFSTYNIEALLKVALEREDKAEDALIAYEKGEWQALFEYQRFNNRISNGEFPFYHSSKEVLSQFTLDVSLKEKQWLIYYNVTPIFGADDVVTLFHNFPDEKQEQAWLEAQKRIDAKA